MDKPKPHPIAQAVLTILHRLLGGSMCFVGRILGPELMIHEALDPHGLGVTKGQSVPLLDTMSGVVERTRATAVCDDESAMACPFEKGFGLRSGLAVPLLQRDGNIIGTLCALDRVRRTYSPQDVELVVDLARVVVAELEEGQVLDRAVELERVRLAGLLARGLAHDFGNVVASALANVRSLHRVLGDHPQAREPIEELSASLEAGRELVARLREVGRSDAGRSKRRGIDPTAVASK
ncbi:MAG: GAF domain-containing protein, partial [Polyangiales bacterium]